jgi:hypothetical protein
MYEINPKSKGKHVTRAGWWGKSAGITSYDSFRSDRPGHTPQWEGYSNSLGTFGTYDLKEYHNHILEAARKSIREYSRTTGYNYEARDLVLADVSLQVWDSGNKMDIPGGTWDVTTDANSVEGSSHIQGGRVEYRDVRLGVGMKAQVEGGGFVFDIRWRAIHHEASRGSSDLRRRGGGLHAAMEAILSTEGHIEGMPKRTLGGRTNQRPKKKSVGIWDRLRERIGL